MLPSHLVSLLAFFFFCCLPQSFACSGKIDLVLCLDGSGSIGFNDYKKVQNFAKDFIAEFSNQGKSFNGEEGLKIGGTFVLRSVEHFAQWEHLYFIAAFVLLYSSCTSLRRLYFFTAVVLLCGACTSLQRVSFFAALFAQFSSSLLVCGSNAFSLSHSLPRSVMEFSSNNNKFTDNPVLSSDYAVTQAAAMKNRVNGGTRPDYCLNDAKAAMASSAQGGRADAEKIIFLVTDGAPNHAQNAKKASDECIAAGILIIGVGVATGSGTSNDNEIKKMISPPIADNYIKIDDFDDMKKRLQSISEAVCPIDCAGTWNEWGACDSATATRTRTFQVTDAAKDGGEDCPVPETESCAVDCEYSFSGWTKCTTTPTAKAYYGPWGQSRTVTVTQQPQNGGAACPSGESRPCQQSICYDVTSEDASFPSILNVKAIESLPTNHPARTRTDCGGAVASGLPQGPDGCGLTESELFYAFDATSKQSKSTVATPGTSKFMVLRDSDAHHTSFVILNGPPSSGEASYKLKIKFINDMKGQQAPTTVWNPETSLPLLVKDAPQIGSGGTCVATGGKDCYNKYNANSRNGRMSWSWSGSETSGGTFGPLPLHGWCVNVQVGDTKGVDSFQVEDYVGAYTTSRAINQEAMDYGINICVKLCTCEGEACGTGAPAAGDTCNGVPCGHTNPTPPSTGGGGSGGNSGGNSGGSGNGGDNGGDSGGSGMAPSGSSGGTPSTTGGTCSSGHVNAMGDGCESGCSSGTVNAAGNGCAATCSSGTVNALGDGCDVACSSGAVNAMGDGCEEPGAVLESAGKFEAPGDYENAGDFTPNNTKEGVVEGDGSGDDGDDGSGDGGGGGTAVVVVMLLTCAFFVAGMVYLREKRQGPFKEGGKLSQYGKKQTLAMGSEGDALPEGWESYIDEASNMPVYFNNTTGEQQWDKPSGTVASGAGGVGGAGVVSFANPMGGGGAGSGGLNKNKKKGVHGRTTTTLPSGWNKDVDDGGNKYYYDVTTGETSWVPPPGSTGGSSGVAEGGGAGDGGESGESGLLPGDHVRSHTVMPSGWGKDVDGEGNKYYYDETSGDTSWVPPPGSTGGSAGV